MAQTEEFLGTGRRKRAIARVRLADGSGKVTVNGHDVEDYFNRIDLPSFKNHLKYFSFAPEIIIDNTNYNQPEIKDHKFFLSKLLSR